MMPLLSPAHPARPSPRPALLITFSLALLATPAPGQAEPSGPASSPSESIQAVAEPYLAPLLTGPRALRGLMIGVVHGNRREFFGYGKVGSDGRAPDRETLFKIASLTKPFTALLLAQLSVEGKLAYGDTALSFHGQPVTYRQLVTHTSGLPLLPAGLREESVAEFRRFLGNFSLPREPGSKFEYSTTGFGALGLCLTPPAGSGSFEAGLTARILTPLGLTSTTFELPQNRAARFAGDAPPAAREHGPNPFNPAGGLISSADNLLRFVSAQLSPDRYPALARAIRLTQEPCPDVQPTFPGCSSALGWFTVSMGPTARFYFASGVTSGFRAFLAFDPVGRSGVVMLTNTDMSPEDPRMEMAGFPLLATLAYLPPDPIAPQTGASRQGEPR